jgi:tetratricopeptide (TPR) repeat protein
MLVIALLAAGALLTAPASARSVASDSTAYGSPDALVHYSRGRLLEEEGQVEEALAEYYRAVASDAHAVAPLRRVSELSARKGDAGRSLEFAQRALAAAPADPRSLWLEGAALFNLGRSAESLMPLVAAAEGDSENVEYWRTLARAADHERRYDLLVRAWRASADLDDADPETWFQLAGALARTGDFAEADSALRVAREGNPARPGIEFLGGWIEEGLGHDDQAIDDYAHHLKLHPDDTVTRQRRVALLAERERWAEAYREEQVVAKAEPGDAEALGTAADLAFRAGKPAEGREYLHSLEHLDSSDPENAGRAILVLANHKHAAEGVAIARSWTGAHPSDWRGPLLEARALALADSTDAAIARARDAVVAAPDSLLPQLVLGRIAQKARRWKVAVTTWEGVLQRRPREIPVTLDLSYCLEQDGDVESAVTTARGALSESPDSPTVLNFLGYLLADHGRDLHEAERLIERATTQEPDNGAFIDSKGWVLYRLGKLAEARQELERAAQLTHGDPTVLEHLGDVYRDLRLLDLARAQYRRSLSGDATNQRVRNKLEAIR